jgi:hypothetical protein
MSGGKLVKILLKTRVSRYLEWKGIKIILNIQQSMEHTSYKTNKQAFSLKVVLKLLKFQ